MGRHLNNLDWEVVTINGNAELAIGNGVKSDRDRREAAKANRTEMKLFIVTVEDNSAITPGYGEISIYKLWSDGGLKILLVATAKGTMYLFEVHEHSEIIVAITCTISKYFPTFSFTVAAVTVFREQRFSFKRGKKPTNHVVKKMFYGTRVCLTSF